MSNYIVSADFGDARVCLQVDDSIFTEELARELYAFYRGDEAAAKVVDIRTKMLKKFGGLAIMYFCHDGGRVAPNPARTKEMTEEVQAWLHEGWGDKYEHLGITIYGVDVEIPTEEDLSIREM